jgi:hypothetical protein
VHNPFHFSSLCSPQPSISCDIMFRIDSKLYHASNILSKSQDPHPTNIIVFSIFLIEALYFPLFLSSSVNFVFIGCCLCVVADGVTEEEQDREPEPEDPYLEKEHPEGFEDGKSNPIL